MSKCSLYYNNILVFIFLVTSLSLFAQGERLVEWVAEYPPEGKGSSRSAFEVLDQLVFGAKQEVLLKPVSVVSNGSGKLYFLSQGNGKVLSCKEGEGRIKNVLKSNQDFSSLVDLCNSGEDSFLFTDSYLNKIFVYSAKAKDVKVFTSDSLERPTGIAWSETDKLVWVVETAAHRITAYSLDGTRQRSIGTRGSRAGEFNFPTHIWIDEEGRIFVVDAMNYRVQLFSSTGDYLTEFGEQGDSSGKLARPKGIATDSEGNIYLVDALFHTVQIFNKDGDFLYYFGGQGKGKGQFWMPGGIYIDRKDYIYVADTYNNRVQVFKFKGRPKNE